MKKIERFKHESLHSPLSDSETSSRAQGAQVHLRKVGKYTMRVAA